MRITIIASCLFLAIQPGSSAQDTPSAGLSPSEALARMTLPEGFHAELFASEPEIRQPVAATFDERGRMWVVEYLQYPTPAGVKPVTVDQYLRTEYDKLPDPPPHGPKGADRIKILEDSDADGRADKVTTFVDGLNLASGVAIGYGGVFVANAPYLIYYPDKDRNDIPDGPPEVLLSGFGIQDAHAVINSLTWGPDGWLYGAQGSTVTAKVQGYEFQQGIWRYHPITKKFELFAEGGGNTWGIDFDRAGNLFGSSNGSFIAFHMVQGGYYWKGFAKHGPLHNPRAYGYFNAMDFEGQKPGGHVTPGGIVYKGGAYPPEYDGAFIGPNLLANSVYWYKFHPKGSTFSLSLGGTLLDSKDKWFRPIDALTGPDGCVYIVDWYDKRASHLDPRDNWDRTNGRIYRIVHGTREIIRPFDLSTMSTKDLIALRTHKNAWWPETALRVLFERKDASVIPQLVDSLKAETDPTLALRDLWALDACGGLADNASALLGHESEFVRTWVVRRLGDVGEQADRHHFELWKLARNDPSIHVRAQLASTSQRMNLAQAAGIVLSSLVEHGDDHKDPHVPLRLWWAVEAHTRKGPYNYIDVVDEDQINSPLVRDFLLERIARSAAESNTVNGFLCCQHLLKLAMNSTSQSIVLSAIDEGLRGHAQPQVPSKFREAMEALASASLENQATARRILMRLGNQEAISQALEAVESPQTSEDIRVALIDVIGEIASPMSIDTLLRVVLDSQSPAVHSAALRSMRRFGSPEVAPVLLSLYPNASTERALILSTLCSRKSWATTLLDSIEANKIPAKDLTPAHVLLIMQQGDSALNARLEKLWGKLPGAGTPEKDQRIAEVRGILPEGDKGDPARGRKVFQEQCANCHRLFGEGAAIGPDLSGAERGDLTFLLESTVDPSRQMRKEYQGVTVATKDGRVLTGLVVEQNDQYLVLFDSAQQKTTIPRAEIEETKDAANSVMPEGLLDKLPDDQVRDLFRYLQSSGQ